MCFLPISACRELEVLGHRESVVPKRSLLGLGLSWNDNSLQAPLCMYVLTHAIISLLLRVHFSLRVELLFLELIYILPFPAPLHLVGHWVESSCRLHPLPLSERHLSVFLSRVCVVAHCHI